MSGTIFQMLITVAAIPLCDYYLSGVHATDMTYALIAGAVMAAIYLILRPIAKLVTKALSFLTLGLLSIIVDAWLVQLCALFMKGNFQVDSIWWAALVALIINAARFIIGLLFGKK
jgi:Predicted membrane protein